MAKPETFRVRGVLGIVVELTREEFALLYCDSTRVNQTKATLRRRRCSFLPGVLKPEEVGRVINQHDGTTVELRHIVPATKVRLLHDVTATKEEWMARRGE